MIIMLMGSAQIILAMGTCMFIIVVVLYMNIVPWLLLSLHTEQCIHCSDAF